MITITTYKPTAENKKAVFSIFKQYPDMFYAVDLKIIKQRLVTESSSQYPKYIALENEQIVGFISFARPNDTDSIWFLSWFAVDDSHQNRGIGSKLLSHVEEQIRKTSAPRLYIDTVLSDESTTTKTRTFYEKHNYKEAGVIPDYYDEGLSKIIYFKDLSA